MREPHTGTEVHPLSAEKLRLLTPLHSPAAGALPTAGASPAASPPSTPRAADLSARSPPQSPRYAPPTQHGAAKQPLTPGSSPAGDFGSRFQAEAQRLGGDLPNHPSKVPSLLRIHEESCSQHHCILCSGVCTHCGIAVSGPCLTLRHCQQRQCLWPHVSNTMFPARGSLQCPTAAGHLPGTGVQPQARETNNCRPHGINAFMQLKLICSAPRVQVRFQALARSSKLAAINKNNCRPHGIHAFMQLNLICGAPYAQVSFQALARSPKLAARARAQLNARQHTNRIQKEDGSEVSLSSCLPCFMGRTMAPSADVLALQREHLCKHDWRRCWSPGQAHC